MTIDHLGYAFSMGHNTAGWEINSIFRIIGRLAFPLFMFLLAEGMNKTHRRGRHLGRVFAMFALITVGECIVIAIPYFRDMGFDERRLDPHPFIDIFLNGAMLFFLYQKGWKKILAAIPISVIVLSFVVNVLEANGFGYQAYFPYFIRSGYDLIGLTLSLGFTIGIWGFHKVALKKGIEEGSVKYQGFANVSAILAGFLLYSILALVCCLTMPNTSIGITFFKWQSFCLLALIMILFYNGKRGYDKPWWRIFSYWYFLIHMGIIALLVLFVL